MKRALVPTAICIACVLLLASCVDTRGWIKQCDHRLPERGKWTDPLYPGARNVKQEKGLCCFQVTTRFETSDGSEVVVAYYERAMRDAGWQADKSPWEPHDLYFTIENCCYYGTATVDATRTPSGTTQVEVLSAWSMGCG